MKLFAFYLLEETGREKVGRKRSEIMKSLKNLGMKVHLSIVGANPEVNLDSDEFTIYENLDIKIEQEKEVYFSLLMNSHFFILPTLNEAFGIAYVEAFSFGLPVISHRVCAMEEIVDHQKTGLLFDVDLLLLMTSLNKSKNVSRLEMKTTYRCKKLRARYLKKDSPQKTGWINFY